MYITQVVPDYYFVRSKFGYDELERSGVKSKWLHRDKGLL